MLRPSFEQVFGRRTPLDSLYETMAVTSARYPATIEFRFNVRTAYDSLSLLLLSSFFSDEPWKTEVIVRTIAQKAFAARYSGKWRQVQEILELENPTPLDVISHLLHHCSTDDLFGNLVPRAKSIWTMLKIRDSVVPDRRPVLRPQFRRGYRDKGSRRLPHELHGEPPSRPPSIDRRHKVHFNPLVDLRMASDAQSENWSDVSTVNDEPASQKGGTPYGDTEEF